jgi:hypothetical protein
MAVFAEMVRVLGRKSIVKLIYSTNLSSILLVFLLWLLPVSKAYAGTYYVDASNGKDSNSGKSAAKAWRTIARVNEYAEETGFESGDIIRLKRGEIWTNDECLGHRIGSGTGTNWVDWGNINGLTIEDYGTGQKPRLDGNTQRPIYLRGKNLSNVVINNIDISGQDWSDLKYSNLCIIEVNGVTLNGIRGDGYIGSKDNHGKNAISISSCTGEIEVKNCVLNNWGQDPILTESSDYMGIIIANIDSGTISVHHNTVFNTIDALHYFNNSAYGRVFDNEFFNGGENSIDCKSSKNVEFYNNRLYREPSFNGTGGTGGGSLLAVHDPYEFVQEASNILIYHNIFKGSDKNYIQVSEMDKVEISYNTFTSHTHSETGVGIKVSNSSYTDIHHNYFESINGCILISDVVHGLEVYNNILLNPNAYSGGAIHEDNKSGSATKIYNNTIYNESGSSRSLIVLLYSNGTMLKNNVVQQNIDGTEIYPLKIFDFVKPPVVENNCWYNSKSDRIVKTSDKRYNKSDAAIWAKNHKNDIFRDPLFIEAGAGDLRLRKNSPCVNAGEQLGQAYNMAFISVTDDFDYRTSKQSLHGNGWEIGAFVYSDPKILPPKRFRIKN